MPAVFDTDPVSAFAAGRVPAVHALEFFSFLGVDAGHQDGKEQSRSGAVGMNATTANGDRGAGRKAGAVLFTTNRPMP
jgi:hypothetical protein